MKKKLLFALALAILNAGWSFAQADFAAMPKNTLTVDIGPIIAGGFMGGFGIMIGEVGLQSSGFGIAAQYERQVLERMSIAGRFAYLGYGLKIVTEAEDIRAEAGTDIASFSIEGHTRYFPFKGTFFLDGMLGYANMSISILGQGIASDIDGRRERISISLKASRSYIKMGAKLGWRIDFGNPGGFVFEPSFGYYGGFGLGKTLGLQLAESSRRENDVENINVSDFDTMFAVFEDMFFIGGPRLSLAFGWRF